MLYFCVRLASSPYLFSFTVKFHRSWECIYLPCTQVTGSAAAALIASQSREMTSDAFCFPQSFLNLEQYQYKQVKKSFIHPSPQMSPRWLSLALGITDTTKTTLHHLKNKQTNKKQANWLYIKNRYPVLG